MSSVIFLFLLKILARENLTVWEETQSVADDLQVAHPLLPLPPISAKGARLGEQG